MDALLTVIVIGAVVAAGISVGAIFLVRKRNKHKKTTDLVQRFIEAKARSRAKTKEELARLEKSYTEGKIDKETYDRLRNVLLNVKSKKDEEVDVFKYVINKSKKKSSS